MSNEEDSIEKSDGQHIEFRPETFSSLNSDRSSQAKRISAMIESEQKMIDKSDEGAIPEEIIHGIPEEDLEHIYYKYESEVTPEEP